MKNLGLVMTFLLCLLGTASFAIESDSASVYYTQAKEFQNNRNFKKADEAYRNAIRLNPRFDDARIAYGVMLLDRSMYPAGREQLTEVLKTNPNNTAAVKLLFEDARLNRQWKDVLKYGEILQKRSLADSVDESIGKAYYNLEEYGKAIDVLEKLVARNPVTSAVIMLGKAYTEVSDYRKAALVYEKALKNDKANATLWYEYALILTSIPAFEESAAAMEKAVEAGIKQDMAFKENMAMVYLSTTQYEKGIALIEELLQKKPNDANLMFMAGQAYYKNKSYDKAIGYWERTVIANASNYRALYMTGMAYQKMGKNKKGMDICDQAIAGDPSLSRLRTQQ